MLIAEGGGAIVGGLILVALFLPLLGVGLGIAAFIRKRSRSLPGAVFSGLSLYSSASVIRVLGLPHHGDHWGAYLSTLPMGLSLLGIAIFLFGKRSAESG
jgi:hypothetical protein